MLVAGRGRLDAGWRAVLTVSLLAFALDLLYGMVVPTFSLYVAYLGGSTFAVGLLAATVSITQLAGAFPIGALSDRAARKTAFVAGSALFCAASLLLTVPSEPWLLIGPRFLFGLALLATFPVGLAYLADAVAPSRRAVAIGIYVSAQGLGFTLGPLLGGWIADARGFHAVYDVCAGVGLAVVLGSWLRLEGTVGAGALPKRESVLAMGRFLRGPLFGAGLSNTFMLLMANGAILPFLSLYAARLGLGTLAVGALYAMRSGASVLARLPAGLLNRRVSNATLVLVALAADALAAVAIGLSDTRAPLFAAALVDGVCFGIFMTAGQCIVADEAPPGRRGAATGAFAAAGALGETVGALAFGVLAQILTIRAVFFVAGALLVLSIPVVLPLLRGAAAVRDRPTAPSI